MESTCEYCKKTNWIDSIEKCPKCSGGCLDPLSQTPCPLCKGKGSIETRLLCPVCNPKGEKPDKRIIIK